MPVKEFEQRTGGLLMTDKEKQIQRAQDFQALHKKGDLLLLPNI
ncbi:hypothetical protein [Streptococcus sp. DD12]|nr:hypothetical protein [Streptococcus sp. DD12]KXT75500.1 hypothetical protein STRDD12_01311 [Streptococcus sp. DD12]